MIELFSFEDIKKIGEFDARMKIAKLFMERFGDDPRLVEMINIIIDGGKDTDAGCGTEQVVGRARSKRDGQAV